MLLQFQTGQHTQVEKEIIPHMMMSTKARLKRPNLSFLWQLCAIMLSK